MLECMKYLENMEQTDPEIMKRVLLRVQNFGQKNHTREDILNVLNKNFKDIDDLECLLSPVALDMLDEIAKAAQIERFKHFGNNVYLFTPLYISNFCENGCIYCGFNAKNKIVRAKLSFDEIEAEMKK